jgi:hypothetical protein
MHLWKFKACDYQYVQGYSCEAQHCTELAVTTNYMQPNVALIDTSLCWGYRTISFWFNPVCLFWNISCWQFSMPSQIIGFFVQSFVFIFESFGVCQQAKMIFVITKILQLDPRLFIRKTVSFGCNLWQPGTGICRIEGIDNGQGSRSRHL